MHSDTAPVSAPQAHCDVLVIGAGPAGSTVSAYLAQFGHHVVLLEKAHHPRFHIGESLLPANLPLFEDMGIADEVKAIGMYKPGAEFYSPSHDKTERFSFAEAWDKSMPHAYQVPRAAFDHILIQNAARRGAEVHEGCKVTAVTFQDQTPDRPDNHAVTVSAQCDDGRQRQWRARFVVDASGRDTFLANRFKIRERNTRHNSSAVYGHFRGAVRNEGAIEGNITVHWFEHGWYWFIPLANGITSVGMVTWPYHMKSRGQRSLQQFFLDNIAESPKLQERLAHAELASKVEATGNFAYVSQRCHGPNYLMLGDAYAFIDPVFSSGVWLAMHSGEVGAKTIDTCLKHPRQARAALKRFDRVMRHGPNTFSWIVYRMTNPIMRDLFMGPRNILRVKEALLSVLAGDIFGKTPIWPSLLVFKSIYYAGNIVQPRRAFTAWKQRRANIRAVDGAHFYNA